MILHYTIIQIVIFGNARQCMELVEDGRKKTHTVPSELLHHQKAFIHTHRHPYSKFAITGKGRHRKRSAWVVNIAIEWFPYTNIWESAITLMKRCESKIPAIKNFHSACPNKNYGFTGFQQPCELYYITFFFPTYKHTQI